MSQGQKEQAGRHDDVMWRPQIRKVANLHSTVANLPLCPGDKHHNMMQEPQG